MVELVATLSPGQDQPGILEDVEVLRDGLAGRARAVVRDQSNAQLEQGLPVPCPELIEDGPARRVGQGLEDIAHHRDDRQVATCMSSRERRAAGSGLEAVADATEGEDLGPARGLDLASQARDVGLEPEEVGIGLGGPAGTDEAKVGDEVAVRADEGLGEAVLDGREVKADIADARLVAAEVERQTARGKASTLRRPRPHAGAGPATRSARRMTAAIRASSSARPKGLTR